MKLEVLQSCKVTDCFSSGFPLKTRVGGYCQLKASFTNYYPLPEYFGIVGSNIN